MGTPVVPPSELPAADLLRAHQMFFTGVAAVLALLHAVLYALQPQRRENFWCALFLVSYGTVVYANFEAGHERVFLGAIAVAALTWLVTLHTIFGVERPKLVMAIALAAAGLGVWGMVQPGPLSFIALLGLAIVAGIIAAVEIGHALHAGHSGTRWLGAGMTLLALTVVYSALRTLGWAPDMPWLVYLPIYGGLGAALSLSVFLAHRHATTARHLEEKLLEVERLSSAALAQEQEKQRFIAAKNAELETLVAARTSELQAEKTKVDDLLYNMLPREAADELKAHGRAKPRRYEDVTVLFTDFQGFTNTVSAMPADKLVTELNDIFNRFDDLIDRHGLQKIKTIGDAYMAAGGIPEAAPDTAHRVVAAALDMTAVLAERNRHSAVKWRMRLGVHTGVVVAGVIGKRRLVYDLFGDTVNIASRMESHGRPGFVNLSAYTYDLVRDRFACDYLGKIDVKGKGEIDIYSVQGGASA